MKKIVYVTIVLTLIMCLNGCSSNSSNDNEAPTTQSSWTKLNFTTDGSNMSICSNGANLFVGTNTLGVFMSSDNGDTWVSVNNGIVDKKNCVVFSIGNAVFVSTTVASSNLPDVVKYYKSTNNGQNWTPVWTNIQNTGYGCPAIIYSFGSTLIGSNTNSYFYKSVDNGTNWTVTQLSPQSGYASKIDFVYDGTNIFARTMGYVYKSSNSSAFNLISIPNSIGCDYITTLGTKIYIAGPEGNGGGIYMSSNSGNNWTAVNHGLEIPSLNMNHTIDALYSDGTNLYAGANEGVFFSSDSGANWSELGGTPSGTIPNGDFPGHILRNGSFLYVRASSGNIYRMQM